jgi:hypothetical protein
MLLFRWESQLSRLLSRENRGEMRYSIGCKLRLDLEVLAA